MGDGVVADVVATGGQGGGDGGQPQGGAGGGGQGGGDQQQQQQQQDRWQDKFLSQDLRGNEALARYGSVDDMAKGLIETQNWARGRVAVPKADDAAAFAEFAGKVRPADAKDYAIAGADGKTTEFGEAFRQKAFEMGLHPLQAKGIVEWNNQQMADQASKITQAGKDEVTAIELELGPQAYNQRLAAVDSMLKGMDIDIADIAVALEQTVGAGKTLRGLFTLAERTGELAKVDGADVALRMGAMTAEQAQAEVDRMSGDPEISKQLNDPKSPESLRRKELLRRIAQGDARR